MKKVLAIVLSTFMIMGVTGCSKNEASLKEKDENQIAQEGTSQEDSIESIYFGRVKKVVGNEVELNIAKELGLEGVEGEGGGISSSSSSSSADGSESPESVEDLGATSEITVSDSAESEKGVIPDGGTEMKQEIIDSGKGNIELEYTGENKSFTIPAGAKIFDFTSGREVKISDVKEGDVIRAYTKKSGDTEVVFNLEIVQ